MNTNNQLDQEKKNSHVFTLIVSIATPVLLVVFYFLASTPFAALKESMAWIAIPIAYLIWLAVCIISVLKHAEFTELNPFPYMLLIALFFAMCYVLFHQPTGLSL